MRKLSSREIAEAHAREFLGDETWKRWKLQYDECMAFRKSLKGKPTDEQRLQLATNAAWITFCDYVLWHSSILAAHGKCECAGCQKK